MFKVSMNGDGEHLLLAEILDGLNLNMEQFRRMCIAAGCDYLKSIKGIGIKRAFQIVISEHNLMELLSLRGASDEYKERFYKVEAVFKHQTVFDLEECITVPLQESKTKLPSDVQHLCGK